jgi:SAM-dependent methyltransferase
MAPVPLRHLRQRFLAEHLDARELAILEIGALDSPTWMGDNTPPGLRFLDHLSAVELAAKHADNPRRLPERTVALDYVVSDKRFASTIEDRFDLVIANHVIEHIADPIGWLREIAALTGTGGRLLLAVPDRRYTFDYLRRPSTALDLRRAHRSDLERPSYHQALEALYLYRPLHAEDCWPGPPPPAKLRQGMDLASAMPVARRAEREYVDCHCFVFSETAFPPLIEQLRAAGLIAWRVLALRPVLAGGNEFLVLLGAGVS